MHLSYIPQYTIQNRNVLISVLDGVLWDMGQVHCETGLLLLWDRTTVPVSVNSQGDHQK